MARNDYTLAVFDENGNERHDEQGAFGSAKAAKRLQQEPITDVFLMSHGWESDVPDALSQYNAWTDAMLANPDDLTRLASLRPGFKTLMVGVHWPSKPWGDEQAIASFGIDLTAGAFDPVGDYSKRLGDTPQIRAAVQRIFDATAAATNMAVMPPELAMAYRDLDHALALGSAGIGGPPGADRQPFDPQAVFAAARNLPGQVASFGGFSLGGLLEPLRVLSFWAMKDRARKFGESGGTNLLRTLQAAAGGRDVRFHLMGHSFGCIVVSAMLAGPRGGAAAASPVHSAVLVEGALSLWSYAPQIPPAPGTSGYFDSVVTSKKVTGPIVTTISVFDRAVGVFYPLGAGIAQQSDFAQPQFPLFGAVGTFGLQGLDHTVGLTSMLAPTQQYGFQPGQIYNIESSNIIKNILDKISGSHNDISHPEVGHVVWQAAMAPQA
jgi:hypothetical protein